MDGRKAVKPIITDPDMYHASGSNYTGTTIKSTGGPTMGSTGSTSMGPVGMNHQPSAGPHVASGDTPDDKTPTEPSGGFMDMIYNNKWTVITIVVLLLMIFIIMWFWPSKKTAGAMMPTQEQPPPYPISGQPMTSGHQSQQPYQQHQSLAQSQQSSVPQSVPQSQPQQSSVPQSVSQSVPQSVPQSVSQSVPQSVSQSVPQSVPQQSYQQPAQVQSTSAMPQAPAKSQTDRARETLQNILDTAASSTKGVKADNELASLMSDEPPSEQKVVAIDAPEVTIEMTAGDSDEDRELRNLLNQLG